MTKKWWCGDHLKFLVNYYTITLGNHPKIELAHRKGAREEKTSPVNNPALLAGFIKVKDSYNVDAITCAVGAAAIADQEYKLANVNKIKASRTKLANELQQLGFKVLPSQANFLLFQPPKGNAEYLYQTLKQQGILVRYFQQPHLEDKLRITVGTELQNQVLSEAIAQLSQSQFSSST